jgi:hypothetical protein
MLQRLTKGSFFYGAHSESKQLQRDVWYLPSYFLRGAGKVQVWASMNSTKAFVMGPCFLESLLHTKLSQVISGQPVEIFFSRWVWEVVKATTNQAGKIVSMIVGFVMSCSLFYLSILFYCIGR